MASSLRHTTEVCVADLLASARRDLSASPFAPSPREATLLLSHLTGASEASILAHGEATLDPATVCQFAHLLERRLQGEPVAYLIGHREFYGRDFRVDHRVLIPRPETEHLIAAALDLPLPSRPRIVDVGTGSGAIAVTLAAERPLASLIATDRSCDALAVAMSNARRHGVEARIAFLATDLTSALDLENIDLVVSNPPYLDQAEAAAVSFEVRGFEPHLALFSP